MMSLDFGLLKGVSMKAVSSFNIYSNSLSTTIISLFLVACFASVPAAQDDQIVFPEEIDGWIVSPQRHIFIGDELFDYINGGAEIYHEYGFEKVTVADYERAGDVITAEVYRMITDAFGIYSLLRGEGDGHLDMGNGGVISDYYLIFWSGNHIVAVTAQTEFDNSTEAVKSIAQTISDMLEKDGKLPAMLDIVPTQNRLAGSEKYVVGPIGLQNVSALASRLLSGYEEGAAARYGSAGDAEGQILILRWANEGSADEALHAARKKAGEISNLEVVSSTDRSLRVKRETSWGLAAYVIGQYIIVSVGLEECEAGDLFEEIRKKAGLSGS